MKIKKDLMHVREKYNRFGELSFELRCSGKDPFTGKNKVYVKTYKVPAELTGKKQIETFRFQCQLEWKEEVTRKSNCTAPVQADMPFIDFAEEYIENIIKTNPEAYNYYRTDRDCLNAIRGRLVGLKVSDMTQPVIQRLCNWLNTRRYYKTTVTVIKSLRPLLRQRKITQNALSQACDLSLTTLFAALQVGRTTSLHTAQTLCRQLGVPLSEYFKVERQECAYSWSANNNVKTFLHGVLQEAVRRNMIAMNYISKEFVRPLKGTRRKKEIIESKEEWAKFIFCMQNEPDLRKKAAFALYLFLGLRNAEVAGLSWTNIDFEAKELTVRHNTFYVRGFGMVTKGTKTDKSMRTIAIPQTLLDILIDYKAWWDGEKERHGDLWEKTNKLFVQNGGKDMGGRTLAGWLDDWQKKNGLKHVTPHGIRHANITLAIANGIDIKTVSARAGHSDIQTTLNIYSHAIKEADREAAERIDQLLKW